ncbi:MAG: GNAT family N-acetyltransferase [Devosia sp.]
MSLVTARDEALTVDEYIDVIGNSTLGPKRPITDRERVAAMISGAGLVVTARLDGRCVGLSRCLTDEAWVVYCADLAVHNDFQGRGIGKALLETLREIGGDDVGIGLFSVPDAIPFYERMGEQMGMVRESSGFWLPRVRGA